MINLRYHIVSLTAVFLAIGIGVAFGATIVDRAAVGLLEREVAEQTAEVERLTAEEDTAVDALQRARDRAGQFESESRSRLLTGHIVERPILAIAPQGTSQETIAAFEAVALDSGSSYAGLVQFTSRLGLGRPTDLAKLSVILDRDLEAPELRRVLAERMAEMLLNAANSAEEPSPDLTIPLGSTTIPPTPTTSPVITSSLASEDGPTTGEDEPDSTTTGPLVTSTRPSAVSTTSTTISEALQRREAARLAQESYDARRDRDALAANAFFELLEADGFLTYTRSRARTLEEVLKPDIDMRIVVLSDADALEIPALWVEDLVRTLAADGVAPVVVAQPENVDVEETNQQDPDDSAGGENGEDSAAEAVAPAPHDLIGRVRGDAETAQRLSTVSHLDTYEGQVATVFALEDLVGRVGHYGPESDTDGLVPDDSP